MIHGSPEESLQAKLATVRKYGELGDDWDTHGSHPACSRAIEFAVKLMVEAAVAEGVPLPNVAPMDGGVYLGWELGEGKGNRFEVEANDECVLSTCVGRGVDQENFTYSEEDYTYSVGRCLALLVEAYEEAGGTGARGVSR